MSKSKKLLVIGKVWPEPASSAAGKRMLQLLYAFQRMGWEVVFSSAASIGKYSVDLEQDNISMVPVKLNDSEFDVYVKDQNPSVVLFDRFMTEEQFGWRVAEQCPGAIRILDTEDLHSLRNSREIAHKQSREWVFNDLLKSDILKRELASIYRCDLSLIISEYEMDILHNDLNVDDNLIHYLPFLQESMDKEDIERTPSFEERKHFVTIGNFLHKPNWDAVLYLKSDIWPLIRNRLPEAELHIYGSYLTQKAEQLHHPKEGFIIKGRAEDAQRVVSNARICLAPLRFGAGLKGKLVEAMQCGTPSITTDIGAEGINGERVWCGTIANNPECIANEAVKLYSDKSEWKKARYNGMKIINERFAEKMFVPSLINRIDGIKDNLEHHRLENVIGSMLLHHTAASSRYMSKWIEEKNK